MLASSLFVKIRGPASATLSEKPVDQEDIDDSESASGTVSDAGSGTVTPNQRKTRAANGGPAATSMAGGRRRKIVRKK